MDYNNILVLLAVKLPIEHLEQVKSLHDIVIKYKKEFEKIKLFNKLILATDKSTVTDDLKKHIDYDLWKKYNDPHTNEFTENFWDNGYLCSSFIETIKEILAIHGFAMECTTHGFKNKKIYIGYILKKTKIKNIPEGLEIEITNSDKEKVKQFLNTKNEPSVYITTTECFCCT